MQYKKLLGTVVLMFGILGLNPALAQDQALDKDLGPVPWMGGADCFVDKCIGDKEEFDFLVGRGLVYSGSTQKLFIDEEGISWSQRNYQRVQIRTASDERNFGLIPAIIDVIRYSHFVRPRNDIGQAKNAVIYALYRAARVCASNSITNISQAWTRGFRSNPIARQVFIELQTIQTNEGCDDLV